MPRCRDENKCSHVGSDGRPFVVAVHLTLTKRRLLDIVSRVALHYSYIPVFLKKYAECSMCTMNCPLDACTSDARVTTLRRCAAATALRSTSKQSSRGRVHVLAFIVCIGGWCRTRFALVSTPI